MTGTCHCGSVSVTVPHKPTFVNFCDCSLCAKTGGVWGYYQACEVSVLGTTKSYRRADYSKPAVEMHFCPGCGTTVYWDTTEHLDGDGAGVNMRVFEPTELNGIEARFPDGRHWFGDGEVMHRRPSGQLGVDVFI